jgi:hypothetical protein
MIRRHYGQLIDELLTDRALRVFGGSLLLTQLFTFLFWIVMGAENGSLIDVLGGRADPICWPYFEKCDVFRDLLNWPPVIWRVLFTIWCAIAMGGAALFFWPISETGAQERQRIEVAWWILLITQLFKWLVLSLDYRMMGNYHYMPFIISFAYLFFTHRRLLLPLLIIGFYVSAGSLKINYEWLSGGALYRDTFLDGIWLQLACAYVVFLELIFIWGLVSKRNWLRWATLLQLTIFHAFSWQVVGFFYPMIMACLLSLFPLIWLRPQGEESGHGERLLTGRLPRAHLTAITMYAIAQFLPHIYGGDPALTSEGRLWSLNMFDSKSRCSLLAIARHHDGTSIDMTHFRRELGVRVHCDPIVYMNDMRRLCRLNRGNPNFVDVDFYLNSRRATDSHYTRIIAAKNLCSKFERGLDYNVLFPNPFILPPTLHPAKSEAKR